MYLWQDLSFVFFADSVPMTVPLRFAHAAAIVHDAIRAKPPPPSEMANRELSSKKAHRMSSNCEELRSDYFSAKEPFGQGQQLWFLVSVCVYMCMCVVCSLVARPHPQLPVAASYGKSFTVRSRDGKLGVGPGDEAMWCVCVCV